MSHRIERVNNLIRQEISQLLRREVKDPRLESFIAVTEVSTSPDLKYARVYVSAMSNAEERKEQLGALKAASGFLRNSLMKTLTLRRVPDLFFYWDDSIERGDRISRLIDRVNAEDGEDTGEP